MAKMYSAGTVSVDVVPDTSGFRSRLNAFLHSLDDAVHVGIDADTLGLRRELASATRDRSMTVKVEGDASGLRKLQDRYQRQFDEWRKRPIESKFELDDSQAIRSLTRLTNSAEASSKKLHSFARRSNESLAESITSSVDKMRASAASYYRQSEKLVEQRNSMLAGERDMYDRLSSQITTDKKKVDSLSDSLRNTRDVFESTNRKMRELRKSGDTEAADLLKTTRIPELRTRVKELTGELKTMRAQLKANQTALGELFGKEFDRQIARLDEQIGELNDKWAKSTEAVRKYADSTVVAKARQADFLRDTNQLTSSLAKRIDLGENAEQTARRYAESLPELSAGEQALADAFATGSDRLGEYAAVQSDSQRAMDKHRASARELADVFDEQEKEIRSVSDALRKMQKFGLEDRGLAVRMNDMLAGLNKLRKYAEKAPAKVSVVMDASHWYDKYRQLLIDADKLSKKLNAEHDVDVRVKVWDDQADRLEDRLRKLTHQRVDIPVEWKADQQSIIRRMREVAAQIKANPERAVELEANLDLVMKHAEEKLKRFEDKNDEMKMDLDLETALARAHLAYFTRPRTIDVFANFRGTDMGKIFAGMTSGATGLKGVENQFQRLVNLMDSLDTKVPKFAIMGSAFMAVGAGATNLAGSIGGVAKSLASLSKAAYAAPAALGTVAAGFYGIYAAAKVAGDRFQLANTALKDMQTTVGNAFWDEATDAITRMSDTLGADFVRNLAEVSAEEGRMATGMADIITRANEAGRVNAMLDHAASAVRNLTPGMDAVVESFTSLGRVGGQYVPQLTNWISQNLTHFAQWASEVESDNARVEAAMQGVKEQAGYLGSSIGSLKGVFTGVFGTLAQHENGLQGFSEAVEAANRAVNGIRFQDTLTAWIDGSQRAQNIVRNSFSSIGQDAYSLRNEVYNAFADAGRAVGSTLENVSQLLASSGSGIRDFTDGIASGWSRAMDAIGDSGPVFSDMLTMVGSLANTFGGTFAASLKAASPALRVIASATSAISNAFNSLPEPVKAAAGLWVTFGRAGKTAITSIKSGMLQNIQQTLQYKATMQQLGVTTKQTSASIRELVAAMDSLRRGQVSGALSGGITGVRQLGTEAEEATAKVRGVADAGREVESSTTVIASGSRKAASELGKVGESAAKNAGRLSAVGGALKSAGSFAKSAGGLILDAFGGPAGLAVTAGMALVTTAISDYSLKAQSAETASQNVAAAMKNIATSTQETASSLSAVGKAIKTNLEDVNFGEDGLQGWMLSHTGGALYGQFGDAASAASKLGISLDHVAQSVAGGKTQYQALNRELQEQRKNAAKNTDETGRSVKIDKEKLDAINKLQDTAKKANDQALEQAKTTAKNNGYTDAYVQKLYEMGASYDQIAAKTQSVTQKAENYSNSLKLAAQNQQDHSNAIIAARSAGSLYEKTLAGMGDTIQQVNALASQGQHVLNDQANDFDLTTEAGRLASDALGTLASNAKSYVNAMVDSGDSLDKVNAKNDQMRQSFYDTALQMTGNADAAKALTDQYMMTPSEVETTFKAHVETAKTDMLQYLSLIRDTFPDGGKGDAIYTAIVNAITSGAVTDITGVQQLVHQYTTGNYQAVITADGTPALLQMATVNQLGIQFDGTNYTTDLSAEDLASPKINEVVSALSASGLDGKTIQMILAAKGDAKLTIEQTQTALTKLGASAQDVDIVINAQDHSKAEVDAAIANISKLTGMSKDEIRFMLDATDNASGTMDKVQDKKTGVEKPSSFDITANDDEARVTLARYEAKDGQTIMSSNVAINAEDNASGPAERVQEAILGIPQQWLSWLYGQDDLSGTAGNAADMVRGIPPYWAALMTGVDSTSGPASLAAAAVRDIPNAWMSTMTGVDGTSGAANNATQSVRGIPQQWMSNMMGMDNASQPANRAQTSIRNVPPKWQSNIAANVSGLNMVQSLGNAIRSLASKTIDIVTRYTQVGSPSSDHKAMGGRIVGPGSGTSDSVPAMLSNGEMVIRAASVRRLDAKYGRGFLNALNTYGDASAARTAPNRTVSRAMRSTVFMAQGGRVDVSGMSVEVNPVINVTGDAELTAGVRELNGQLDVLTQRVDMLAETLPQTIAQNSSPWPSKRAFDRDVRSGVWSS